MGQGINVGPGIAIWGENLVLYSAPKFGPHSWGSYGGRGGLSFYVGGKGRYVVDPDKPQKVENFHFT